MTLTKGAPQGKEGRSWAWGRGWGCARCVWYGLGLLNVCKGKGTLWGLRPSGESMAPSPHPLMCRRGNGGLEKSSHLIKVTQRQAASLPPKWGGPASPCQRPLPRSGAGIRGSMGGGWGHCWAQGQAWDTTEGSFCLSRTGKPGGREVACPLPGRQHLLPYKVLSSLPQTASDRTR